MPDLGKSLVGDGTRKARIGIDSSFDFHFSIGDDRNRPGLQAGDRGSPSMADLGIGVLLPPP